MNIAICDDDRNIIEQISSLLKGYLAKTDTEYELECYTSGDGLSKSETVFDMVFIDIQMPGMDGLTAAKNIRMRNENALIIVVTSFNEYLDDAMEINVCRYLSKPLDENRFINCLEMAMRRYFLLSEPVVIQNDDETIKLNSADILYLSIEGRNIIIHTRDRDFESYNNMEWWKRKLNPDLFFQSHKSYLVNLRYVTNFDKSTVTFRSRGKTYKVYVSQRKYVKFKRAFYSYLTCTAPADKSKAGDGV